MAVLFCAQKIARPPDLKIPHGDLEPGAKIRKLTDSG